MRRSTRFLLVPWLLAPAAFAACNAITGASDLKVSDAAGGAGEGAAGEGAAGEGAGREGSSGRGSGGGGAGGGEACGVSSDCDTCCADRAGLVVEDARDYFKDCFCDPLNNSGSDERAEGDLCEDAPDGTCASCCQELCESGGVRPSGEQVSRCGQCAVDGGRGQSRCRSQFAHYCAENFTFGCNQYAACLQLECAGRLGHLGSKSPGFGPGL